MILRQKKQIQEKYYALEKIEEPIEILKKDEKKQRSWEPKRSKGQNEKKINTSLKLKQIIQTAKTAMTQKKGK